jgi:hypothetical protein
MDVAISRFHYDTKIFNSKLTIEQFLDDFLEERLMFHPFMEHHFQYWGLEKQGYPNILYLNFEEMKKDIDSVIVKTMKFLGKEYPKEKLDLLKDHLSFRNMKS